MEERLPGGRNGGAVRAGQTVRRRTGDYTPAVHALLDHLHAVGFHGAPRVLGIDEAGREVLSYLDGDVVGDARPWPAWTHSEAALVAIGQPGGELVGVIDEDLAGPAAPVRDALPGHPCGVRGPCAGEGRRSRVSKWASSST